MRKIEAKHDNPVDNVIIMLCDEILPICTKYKITPNMVTIFRMIFSFFILYELYCTENVTFVLWGTCLFYFLDGLDGHLARSTDQVTILGDYLDHVADSILLIGSFIYIFTQKYQNKPLLITILLLSFYMTAVHFGLQQTHYKMLYYKKHKKYPPAETLDNFNYLHNLEPNNIVWTRYFGNATLIIVLLYSIYFIKSCKCN